MLKKSQFAALAFLVTLTAAVSTAQAFDELKYPDLHGQWDRVGRPRWDEPKTPPLTPEYQAIYKTNLVDMKNGGQGDVTSWYCLPQGMPMMMNMYDPIEVIVTPSTTYILVSHINDSYRRIYTDGRDWPKEIEPSFAGYSIGKWIDEDGDGKYDVLEVETRNIKGPHVYDSTGIPFHKDEEAVIKERIYLDKKDSNVIHDQITVFDHALTQPWTSTRSARRIATGSEAVWHSDVCAEDNSLIRIGKEAYFLSADGYLMPTRKGQRPPDPRFFDSASNKE